VQNLRRGHYEITLACPSMTAFVSRSPNSRHAYNRDHEPDRAATLPPSINATARFRVSPLTLTRWAVQARIGSVRTLGGHTRYEEAEVLRLLHEATQEAGPPGTV
jgi:hypothetical protein